MTSLKALQEKITTFRDERNWKQFHNPKDMILSLFLEVAELAEHTQWKTNTEFDDALRTNKEAVADELADVLYWVLLLAHDLDIDPEQALTEKLVKNAQKYPVESAKNSKQKYTQK